MTAIEARGYCPVVGDHVLARLDDCDYLAGDDELRLADLQRAFADETNAAIFAARGGYGSMRLFPRLDLHPLRVRPRIFVGYSDITSLHLALNLGANCITFHGPNATALPSLNPTATDLFWRLIEQPVAFGPLPADTTSVTTLVGGCAEGELTGGNLCLLSHACGSRYAPDFRDRIVLIEDVGEAIYRADRDLTQLLNAGILQRAAGFVIGTITGWRAQEKDPPRNSPDVLWRRLIAPLGKPTIVGFPFGHETDPLTLPLGVRASLNADARTLTLLEPATL